MTREKRVKGSRFAIVANGFADGPAQALRDYLLAQEAGLVQTVFHPLVPEGDTRHEISFFEDGHLRSARHVRLPFRPPLTYPLDLVVPLRLKSVDCWFGFNSLACARGLVARAASQATTVVYWCVDFVPDRFGPGLVTRAYDALDRLCCRRSDLRFELSEAAQVARNERHGLAAGEGAPVRVVPMGAWIDRVPETSSDSFERCTLVFLGHLVARQGVGLAIDALALLRGRGLRARLEVVGRGPMEQDLRDLAATRGVADDVVFHGFVPDHRDVEHILARASVAVAPYEPRASSLTRFADPGKLKAYLAAGLPILLTDVPPNARKLADTGGAELVAFDHVALANAAERLLSDRGEWQRRRQLALRAARTFDWNVILEPALEGVGFVS